jgi:hypothetical protein
MKQRLSASDLKILAVIAMTADHTAMLFADRYSIFYYVMRLFGRLTAPLMTFLLVEGYRHTRSRRKYLLRLCVFACITQPVYYRFLFGMFPENAVHFLTHWNVLYTFAVSLLLMLLLDSKKIQTASGLIQLGVLISLSYFGDWSYLIPAWTIIFFCYYKRDTKKMVVLFALASVALQTLVYLKEFDSFALFTFQYGTLFSLVPISMYNGQRGNIRHKNLNRWFFYIFYPAHMIVLMAVQVLLR